MILICHSVYKPENEINIIAENIRAFGNREEIGENEPEGGSFIVIDTGDEFHVVEAPTEIRKVLQKIDYVKAK